MNNDTIQKFVIKLRGDNVYDLYMNDVWIASRGHYENIIDELRKVIKTVDSTVDPCEYFQHGDVYNILGERIGSCSMVRGTLNNIK
jgi:hypothetical protein